ncbi:MAG TPA: DegT/DnrJ/EryC1/StrS family aminotransferase [Terriglobales bacterium]|jgi:dTDP-4-amino-4,6-dideoxygalactose transaminase|nr:DegT/DnrJ/EryC1/StrS family aminotransferase [Terriglobales bacterium]
MPFSQQKFEHVPMLDLQRQYKTIKAEILAAIERVCASQQFVLGPEVAALEREVAAYTGAASAVGCASGTDALWLALAASGVKPGDSVVTSPFSFLASASAIVRAGATPVFADIEPQGFNIDPHQLPGKMKGAKAMLPVHLYGQCADIDALQPIADEFKAAIVEDAAQAIGAAWGDRKAGTLGAAAAFSFYPTKNLSAYGDAGLATAADPQIAEHMRRLRNHGSSRRYLHEELGWNARMDAIQGAVLRVKLAYIERWNQQRRERAATYDRLLKEAGLDGTAVTLPFRNPKAHHVFHQYVIRARRRDELREFLNARKIGSEIYYPLPLHLQPCFAYLGYKTGSFPESERAASEVLALPMFPELSEEEQSWVVQSISDFYC